jgi:hypothetical protein
MMGATNQSNTIRYVTAVEIAGRGNIAEQRNPSVAIITAVTLNMRRSWRRVAGAIPPKKKTRLKSGIDAAISKSELLRPATSLPVTRENDERRENISISYVCRSFSPLIAVAVKAGVINRMRRS